MMVMMISNDNGDRNDNEDNIFNDNNEVKLNKDKNDCDSSFFHDGLGSTSENYLFLSFAL